MRVLILGAGMYVTGRAGTGNGTVLTALAQLSREMPVSQVLVVARDPDNAAFVKETVGRVNRVLGTRLAASYQRIPGENLEQEITGLCAEESFDCAIVSLPDHLHAPPLRVLLRVGIPSLVVKPFTTTVGEARELVELQRATGTYGAVEFHKRFDESNLYAKKALTEGLLGQLLYMSVDYSQRIVIPTRIFRSWVEHTNIFQYLGVHYVDLAYFLTGFQPMRLTAYGTEGTLKARGIQAFDSVHVLIEWANPLRNERFLTHYNTNWIDPESTSAMSDQRYKLVGTRGRIEADQRNRGIELVHEGQGLQHVNPYFSDCLPGADGDLEFQGYGFKSIARFVKDVADLRSGETTNDRLDAQRPTFRHALVSSAVIDAVNQALRTTPAWRSLDGLT